MTEREWLEWLCCPLCKGELDPERDAYLCRRCSRRYPVVLGIPDLRVYPDPHLSIAEDHDKGRKIAEHAPGRGFADLLQFYWDHVAKAPPPVGLRRRFIRHVLDDDSRAARLPLGERGGHACLDVGCGASALAVILRARFERVFATDIGFRWLVLERKRLDEAEAPAALVCCCADYLPFRDRAFDLVSAVSLLEHTADAAAVVTDCARVVHDGGNLFVATTNRFSVAPEPHVRIWGLGFLPRRWMPRVVRWRRGLPYDKFHLLSFAELRRLLERAGFARLSFSLPEIRREDLDAASGVERAGARLFERIARVTALHPLLLRLAPLVQVLATRRGSAQRSRAA